jgi:TonB family protein
MNGAFMKRMTKRSRDYVRELTGAMSAIFLAAAASTGCSGLRAPLTPPAQGGPAWVELESKHFTLRSDLSADSARDVLIELEQTYQAFEELAFRSKSSPPGRIEVVVFDQAADYEAVAPEKTDGFFTYTDIDKRPIIVLESGFSFSIREILQHELAHRFVGYFMPRAPVWLNEGMAEFYQTMRFEDGQAILGEASPNWSFYHPALTSSSLRYGINIEALPTATELLAMSREGFYDVEKRRLNYAGAWFFVSMLINGKDEHRRRFWDFAHRLSDGAPADDAWNASFEGVPTRVLDEELRHYALNGKTVVRRAPFKPDTPPSGEASPMPDARVRVLFAKLLLLRGQEGLPKAVEQLEEALQADAELAEAHHWKGLIGLTQKRYVAAEEGFRAAATIEPKEPRYLHGLLMAIAAEEKSRPNDQRAMARLLDPLERLSKVASTPAALNSVGWHYARLDMPDKGLPFAKRAVDDDPGCWECMDTLALLAFEKGWAREALDLQQRALALIPHSRTAPKEAIDRLRKYKAAVKAEMEAAKSAPPSAGEAKGPAGLTPSVMSYDANEMNRPTIIAGKDPAYTKAAIDACVEGTMILRCTITTEGSIANCRVIKTLPHLEAAALAAIYSRRYTPVLYKGAPVNVDYVFNLKFVLPAACTPKPPPAAGGQHPASSSGAAQEQRP